MEPVKDSLVISQSVAHKAAVGIRLHILIDNAWRLYAHAMCTPEEYSQMCVEAIDYYVENIDKHDSSSEEDPNQLKIPVDEKVD